jgi:hypothetical protein
VIIGIRAQCTTDGGGGKNQSLAGEKKVIGK